MFCVPVNSFVVLEAWLWSKGKGLYEMVETLQVRDKITSYVRHSINSRYDLETLGENTVFLVVNSKDR